MMAESVLFNKAQAAPGRGDAALISRIFPRMEKVVWAMADVARVLIRISKNSLCMRLNFRGAKLHIIFLSLQFLRCLGSIWKFIE
jgi:hypothetical protein